MTIEKKFIDQFVNVTSKAALASYHLIGKKDKIAADQAAVDSMRNELNKLNVGEVSEPMRTLNKILFLKLIEKKEISNLENIDLVKLKKSLVTSASNQIFDMHSKNHLSKKKNLTVIKIINE